MSIKNVLCLSIGVRIFIVVVGIGLVFFRCIKSVEVVTVQPVIDAVTLGQVDRLKELLHNGHTPNVVDKDGNSPLSFAMWNGSYAANGEVIELLLQHRADVNCKNKAGQGPLLQTVKIDYKDLRMQVIGKLIKFGAKIGDMDNKGFDLLQRNIETYDTTTTSMILDWWGRLISEKILDRAKKRADSYNLRDIMVVLNNGVVRVKHDAHWDPSIIDNKTGLSDLHFSVIKDAIDEVEKIINKGVSVNQSSKDEYGMRPLHYAVLHGSPSMVEYLLSRNAAIEKKDKNGNTALHMIAWLKNEQAAKEIVTMLLEKNNNSINAQNNNGETLMHMLICDDNVNMFNYLGKKSKSMNLGIRDNTKENCYQLAKRLNRTNILHEIKNATLSK